VHRSAEVFDARSGFSLHIRQPFALIRIHSLVLQDDTHVLINPAYLNYLKDEVMRLFDQNTFERRD
jgi:hypothetical protein